MPDFAGGTNFAILAIITLVLGGGGGSNGPNDYPARQLVASIFIAVWAARLSGFLFFRVLKTGKDDRFDDKRDRFFPFLGFWIFQMAWVWTVSLPVTILNSPAVRRFRPQPGFGTARDVIGVILFAVGFAFEAISDVQRFAFRSANDKSAVCDRGLFHISRHPNYFGDIILHFGKPQANKP